MKLIVKFFDQNYETAIECDSVQSGVDKEYPNTLVVKIVKSEFKTIIRCYPLKNIEYYHADG